MRSRVAHPKAEDWGSQTSILYSANASRPLVPQRLGDVLKEGIPIHREPASRSSLVGTTGHQT